MASCSRFEDYQVGQVLALTVLPGQSETGLASTIHARIRELLMPRTLSCCTIVDLASETWPGTIDKPDEPIFLKLYDRRFSEQLRYQFGIDPWTKDFESAYIQAVRTGKARQFLHDLKTISNFQEDTEELWDDGQNETFLAEQADKLYNNETNAYDALGDIQGELVPRLVARVSLALSTPDVNNNGANVTNNEDLLPVKGVLLQFIPGFSLGEVQDHAPKSAWQTIVDQAVAAVQAAGDRGILNRDVRPDSFLVQRTGDSTNSENYKVVMIDFGLSRLRGADESDRDWAKAKLRKDEEGAVGLVMKKRLSSQGFELHYENSDRYMEYAGGDDEDE
ncbi:hypothetical protein SEUCBS139899_003319 [Sporothrix eucalyptigena]